MTRIPYATATGKPDKIRAILDGSPLNVVRMLANATPEVVEGFMAFTLPFYTASPLPAPLREIAILRAGYIAGSDYETWQHESMARDVGLSDAQIAAVRQGGQHPGVLDEAQQAVLDFAEELVVDVKVGDAALAAVRRHLDDQQLTDLMLVTGIYMTVSRLLETTGVERDEAPITAAFIENVQA